MPKAITKQNVQELLKPRPADGYLNATVMCKAYDKRLNNWLRNEATKSVIDALSLETRIRATKLVEVIKGRADTIEQGTWIHPKLAVQLAQWLDPAFALWVSDLVIEFFANNNQPSSHPSLPQDYETALEQLLATVKQQKALAAKVEEDAPKVESFERLMDAEGLYSIRAAAKILGNIGQNRLFAQLRQENILMKDNQPYQQYVDAGYFIVRTGTFAKNGEDKIFFKTYLTPKGLNWLLRRNERALVA
jgi:phage antirepressor YoqD-like protein